LDEAVGELSLTTEPGHAVLLIDEVEYGRTPWSGTVRAGIHELELRRDGFQSLKETLRVSERGKTAIRRSFFSTLALTHTSVPTTAYVDGRRFCEPPCSRQVGWGEHSVEWKTGDRTVCAKSVRLSPESEETLSCVFKGHLQIEAPAFAELTVDDVEVPGTSRELELEAGDHRVACRVPLHRQFEAKGRIAPGSVSKFRCNTEPDFELDMVRIPAGWFLMGCDTGLGCGHWNSPARKFYLREFYIHRHPVTFAEYERCVESGVCPRPHVSDGLCFLNGENGILPSQFVNDDQPVVCVEWKDARRYCQWIRGDLPTQAEWEKAARGTDGRTYPWGDEEPSYSTTGTVRSEDWKTRIRRGPYPVCKFPDGNSPYGLCDMEGNVYQMGRDHVQKRSALESRNPMGIVDGISQAMGSSFLSHDTELVTYWSDWAVIDGGFGLIGFRCIRYESP